MRTQSFKPDPHRAKGPAVMPGIRVGHASDFRGLTGCTVVLCEAGAVCGVDVRGSAAGTRELTPCLPGHLVGKVHAIFLTGGSAFGLDAAAGVMKHLEERGVGFPAGGVAVPIVPAAVIFDLHLGSAAARPTAKMALAACRKATSHVEEGSVGAGTGATVGKLLGMGCAMKGGVGFGSQTIFGGIRVEALAVVNAFGDVVEPFTGRILAGARTAPSSSDFADTPRQMLQGKVRRAFALESTTLAVVWTSARLDKLQTTKLAEMTHAGLARALRPVHTMFDGDLVFALSLGSAARGRVADLSTLGTAAAEAVAVAIVRAVEQARSLGGVPALRNLP